MFGPGNLMGGILLSLGGMSTAKIRAGSPFRNTGARIGAEGAGLESSEQWLVISGQ